jgi:hypothetical protein
MNINLANNVIICLLFFIFFYHMEKIKNLMIIKYVIWSVKQYPIFAEILLIGIFLYIAFLSLSNNES